MLSSLSNISGHYSSSQAAQILGVSNHEIARLVREGDLSAVKAAGNAFLLDAVDVHLYDTVRQGKGRPLSPANAWAALWMLSGLDVDWLDYSQMRRLRIKLECITPEDLIWQTRKRMSTKRFRVSFSFIPELKGELSLTGKSCITLLEAGLTDQHEIVEGYARSSLADLEKTYHLVEDTAGNALIHIPKYGEPLPLETIDQMPLAIIASDLAITLDSRERNDGLGTLRKLLAEFRNA